MSSLDWPPIPGEKVTRGDPSSLTLNFDAGMLDGYTQWKAQIRKFASAADAVDVTIDTTNQATDTVVLSVTGSQTDGMADVEVWDVQVMPPGAAETVTVFYGRFLTRAEVTR